MLLLKESEIRSVVDMGDAVAAMESAFAALTRGEARLPPPVGLDLPEVSGEVHVKGAHMRGAPSFVFKVACGFYDNPALGLPSASGLMLAFDARTGHPEALLMDNGYLTDLRTGAAGGVAARYLARERPERVGVLGAGIQARMQLRALATVREIPPVALWNRHLDRAEKCADDLREEMGLEVTVCGTPEEAVRGSDLVITVTASREPLVLAEWLGPGTHVTAVGSDGPDKQELDTAVLARADRVFADRLDQCATLGEIHHALEAGVLRRDEVAGELGDLVTGAATGRADQREITVADLTGVGVQDAAIATLALERARERGLGVAW